MHLANIPNIPFMSRVYGTLSCRVRHLPNFSYFFFVAVDDVGCSVFVTAHNSKIWALANYGNAHHYYLCEMKLWMVGAAVNDGRCVQGISMPFPTECHSTFLYPPSSAMMIKHKIRSHAARRENGEDTISQCSAWTMDHGMRIYRRLLLFIERTSLNVNTNLHHIMLSWCHSPHLLPALLFFLLLSFCPKRHVQSTRKWY